MSLTDDAFDHDEKLGKLTKLHALAIKATTASTTVASLSTSDWMRLPKADFLFARLCPRILRVLLSDSITDPVGSEKAANARLAIQCYAVVEGKLFKQLANEAHRMDYSSFSPIEDAVGLKLPLVTFNNTPYRTAHEAALLQVVFLYKQASRVWRLMNGNISSRHSLVKQTCANALRKCLLEWPTYFNARLSQEFDATFTWLDKKNTSAIAQEIQQAPVSNLPALTQEEKTILENLSKEYPMTVTQTNMDGWVGSHNTLRKYIHRLIGRKLICQPFGDKKGYTLTDVGLSVAKR